MKVLLISANTEQINMPVLPLGMAFVARAAEAAGHEVSQLNLMAAPEALKALRVRLQTFQPEIVGISVRNIDDQVSLQPRFLLAPVKAIVKVCREHSTAKIVLGGAGYSIFPEQALAYLEADMGIQGEGEASFALLLARLENHQDLSDIPGLHHADTRIANPPEAVREIDRSAFPIVDRHLFALKAPEDEVVWLPFQTRRGCPLQCSYCSTPKIEGQRTRKRSIAAVLETLSDYVSAGFGHFFFVDNTFNLPPGYATALCDGILQAGLKISWRCIYHPGPVDETLVEKMARAGCVEVSLGMESGSDQILQRMNKAYRTGDVRRCANLMKRYGIRRMGFLLLGGPGETRETVLESLQFADSLALDMVKVTIGIRIYPDTALASHARRVGKLSPDDDLLFPTFYIEDELEDWLRQTVGAWLQARPNWIH